MYGKKGMVLDVSCPLSFVVFNALSRRGTPETTVAGLAMPIAQPFHAFLIDLSTSLTSRDMESELSSP
jgi:hypothetical protein